jgi:hypothetical protein
MHDQPPEPLGLMATPRYGVPASRFTPRVGGGSSFYIRPLRSTLNWTDLCRLLMLFAGPASGFGVSHQHKAGIASLVFFTICGLMVGVGLGQVSSKFAYLVLKSKTLPRGLQSFVYMFIPTAFLFAVLLVPTLLVIMIYG